MDSAPTPVTALRFRRPWYWLAVIALAACAGTAFVLYETRGRVQANEAAFADAQHTRVVRVEQPIDFYFDAAIQLAEADDAILSVGDLSRDRVVNDMVALYSTRTFNPNVYGVGVFYAPYAFDPAVRFSSVYVHRYSPDPASAEYSGPLKKDERLLRDRILVVDSQGQSATLGDDYTKEPWYQRAVANPGQTRFTGPYVEDGRSFITTEKAVYRNHKLLAVVTVDMLTARFSELMRAPLLPGDVSWIESSARGVRLFATGPAPTGPAMDVVVPLRYTGAFVHLTTPIAALDAINRRVILVAAVFLVGIWGLAVALSMSLIHNWRAREERLAFEVAQAKLESEVAVGKRVESELRKTAYTDTLTGLPNRAAFFDRVSAAIASHRVRDYSAFYIDLDRFNLVNETMGHVAGDDLLRTIGARLRSELPPQTLVARIGGDEFLVLAEVSVLDTVGYVRRLQALLREPMVLSGRAVYTEASIGVAPLDERYSTPEEILRDADIAMYAAKASGRNGYAIFDETMRNKVASDSALDNDLRRAVERGEFVPYYQPIVAIDTQDVVSLEALVRWRRPNFEVASADTFIEFAESRGIVDAIDQIVLDAVCADAEKLFGRFPQATVAVNVSAAHLRTPGLAASIARALAARGIPPERVKLEITETAMMLNADVARATLDALRRDGIQILLDDFGAGHSSLGYLHRLPIAGLKIDRSFIEPITRDPNALAIVRSIVALAKTLELYTVAEGVETAEQLEVLQGLGVAFAQGFFFSPALPLAELLRYSARSNTG